MRNVTCPGLQSGLNDKTEAGAQELQHYATLSDQFSITPASERNPHF